MYPLPHKISVLKFGLDFLDFGFQGVNAFRVRFLGAGEVAFDFFQAVFEFLLGGKFVGMAGHDLTFWSGSGWRGR